MPKCAKWEPIKYFFLFFSYGLLSVALFLGCASSREKVENETKTADSSDVPCAGDAIVVDSVDTGGVNASKEPIGTSGASGTDDTLGASARIGTDAGSDGVGGTDNTGDGGVETRVQQDRITFIIYNDTSQTKYLYKSSFKPMDIVCESRGAEEPVILYHPVCAESCRDILEDKIDEAECGYVCDQPPLDVLVLEPGQYVQDDWNGKIYAYDGELCYGNCVWTKNPLVGTYRIYVRVFDEYTCDHDSCPTNTYASHSEILGARVLGAPQIFETIFSVPYPDDTLTITVFDSDTECDDESREQVQCADYCGSDELMQSMCIAGQWACADGQVAVDDCPPDTCWGPPGICP